MVETRGPRITDAKRQMADGELSAEMLTAACLECIADSTGEGTATFIEVFREKALAEARAADLLRAAVVPRGPLAAFCGIVGFKPTRDEISLDSTFALASSFDTVSPMANTVSECRLLFEVLSGRKQQWTTVKPAQLQIGVVPWQALGAFDEDVASFFDASVAVLRKAGACVELVVDFDWSLPGKILHEGRITAVEGPMAHHELFTRSAEYDPHVAARLALASNHLATAYADGLRRMQAARKAAAAILARYNAIMLPTVPINPPALDTLSDGDAFQRINLQVLRHTSIVNVLDGRATSFLKLYVNGPPGALMLMAGMGCDAQLLDVAGCVEATLRKFLVDDAPACASSPIQLPCGDIS